MLLPFQGANTIRLALPRVSSHVVRLALGYVLWAFQAVPTQGVVSRCSPCPGLCAFGLSGRILSISLKPKGDTSLPFQGVPSPTFQTCTTARSAPIRCAPSR